MKRKTAMELLREMDHPDNWNRPKDARSWNRKLTKPSEHLAMMVLEPFVELIGARIALVMQEIMLNYEKEEGESQCLSK